MNAPTTVAHLACDETTARRIAAYLGESLDAEDTACAAFEGDDGRWHVAIHFRTPPDEPGLRELVGLVAGAAAADGLSIKPIADADWVDAEPCRASDRCARGASWYMARMTAHDLRANDISIEIEAALAFGTGHHGTTRGCLLALADLAKRQRATARARHRHRHRRAGDCGGTTVADARCRRRYRSSCGRARREAMQGSTASN